MKNLIIAIDQSTSATKAMLFNERCEMLKRVNVTHEQYYPRTGWVEHDVEEIYRNVLKSIAELIEEETADNMYSLVPKYLMVYTRPCSIIGLFHLGFCI